MLFEHRRLLLSCYFCSSILNPKQAHNYRPDLPSRQVRHFMSRILCMTNHFNFVDFKPSASIVLHPERGGVDPGVGTVGEADQADGILRGKILPGHNENESCDAVFEYTNRRVLLEGQETQSRPCLQAICHAVSHFQRAPVMLKMQRRVPRPPSTAVSDFFPL